MEVPSEEDRERFFRYWREWDERNGVFKGIADAFATLENRQRSDRLNAALEKIQDEISANPWRTEIPRLVMPKEITQSANYNYFTKTSVYKEMAGKLQEAATTAQKHACNLGTACTQHNPKPAVDLSFMATEWDCLPDA